MEFQESVESKERDFRERDAEQNRLDALRDDYYKLYVHAAECEISGGSLANVGGLTAVQLRAANNDFVRVGLVRPRLWRNGQTKITVYWSTDGTESTDVRLRVALNAHVVDSAITTGTDILDYNQDIAPSGTTDILYDDDFTTMTTNILNTHATFAFIFQRLGGTDSNTDDVYFIGATIEFLPVTRQ